MIALVRWNPYEILGIFPSTEGVEVPDGCEFVIGLAEANTIWQIGDMSLWKKAYGLWLQKKYKEIFIMHNEGGWSSYYYCCDSYEKIVDMNIQYGLNQGYV